MAHDLGMIVNHAMRRSSILASMQVPWQDMHLFTILKHLWSQGVVCRRFIPAGGQWFLYRHRTSTRTSASENDDTSVRTMVPTRQEQEGSAKECARAYHVEGRLGIVSIKGYPRQVSGLGRQEQEARLLEAHPFLICAMPVWVEKLQCHAKR